MGFCVCVRERERKQEGIKKEKNPSLSRSEKNNLLRAIHCWKSECPRPRTGRGSGGRAAPGENTAQTRLRTEQGSEGSPRLSGSTAGGVLCRVRPLSSSRGVSAGKGALGNPARPSRAAPCLPEPSLAFFIAAPLFLLSSYPFSLLM